MRLSTTLLLLLSPVLAACNSKLVIEKITNGSYLEQEGVPFRVAEPWVAVGHFISGDTILISTS